MTQHEKHGLTKHTPEADEGLRQMTQYEPEVWVDHDYLPRGRGAAKCPCCGNDLVLRHVCEQRPSPYPTQEEMNAEDAQEYYRLARWLYENLDHTRLAGEPVVDWAIRVLTQAKDYLT